jgi:hypothetical protein
MKKLLGISLIAVGGGGIAYILSIKDKDKGIAFVDNESTKCDSLAYEKEKAWGDSQEFNIKNPLGQTPEKIKSQPVTYWQNITKQRGDLDKKYNTAILNWNNSDCEKSQIISDASDCNLIKANIATLKDKIAVLETNPLAYKLGSATAGTIAEYKKQLSNNQNSYNNNNCLLDTKVDSNVSSPTFVKCTSIDKGIKETSNEIDKLLKKFKPESGLTKNEGILLEGWKKGLTNRENEFVTNNCRDVIENKRLTNTAVVLTKTAEKMEQQVFSKNNNQTNIYIGLGGVVILIGLYIVLKK